ncbi:hypothetical protein [Nostoc sp. CHAB 5715]|uniref:hypothetical protein n=1 Tax=Nostoc sp. CHAB 5715 TaxID=2780400 RepID=UPI001E2B1CB9|nr:hypothetical protein [Nostoc sp. CHAB 5715]MCC5625808.1 hypothetical protein [Nostoc sp. CHAB 5715]
MPPLQRQVSSTDSYHYLLFLPNGVHADRGDVYDGLRLRTQTQQPLLPTILFLHGAGQKAVG